MITENLEKS